LIVFFGFFLPPLGGKQITEVPCAVHFLQRSQKNTRFNFVFYSHSRTSFFYRLSRCLLPITQALLDGGQGAEGKKRRASAPARKNNTYKKYFVWGAFWGVSRQGEFEKTGSKLSMFSEGDIFSG
jgi:hypothetical protein